MKIKYDKDKFVEAFLDEKWEEGFPLENKHIPANSPGFPGSLQVFHEISRSLG